MNLIDFTVAEYERLLDAALDAGYEFVTAAEYLDGDASLPSRFVVLRHDVDRRMEAARRLAAVEERRGVTATYYVRSHLLDDRVRELSARGHEVGYHYEDLAATGGDVECATRRFARNLARFREHVDVRTVCPHGRPLVAVDDIHLVPRGLSLDDHDLLGDAHHSMDLADRDGGSLRYFSDTDRGWGTRVPGFGVVETTADLADALSTAAVPRPYVLVHPSRWTASPLGLAACIAWDVGAASAKHVARRVHDAGLA